MADYFDTIAEKNFPSGGPPPTALSQSSDYFERIWDKGQPEQGVTAMDIATLPVEMAKGFGRGVLGGVSTIAKSVEVTTGLKEAGKLAVDIDTYTRSGKRPIGMIGELIEATESMGQSLTAATGPALIGAAVGGPFGAVTAAIGGKGVLFGLAKYFDFQKKVEDRARADGASDAEVEAIREQTKGPAIMSGLFETGGEITSDFISARIFGILGSKVIKEPVKRGLASFFREYIPKTVLSMPGEVLPEVGTTWGQNVAGEMAGFPSEGGYGKTARVAAMQTAIQGFLFNFGGRAMRRHKDILVERYSNEYGVDPDTIKKAIDTATKDINAGSPVEIALRQINELTARSKTATGVAEAGRKAAELAIEQMEDYTPYMTELQGGKPDAEDVRINKEQVRRGHEGGQPEIQRGAVEGGEDLQRVSKGASKRGEAALGIILEEGAQPAEKTRGAQTTEEMVAEIKESPEHKAKVEELRARGKEILTKIEAQGKKETVSNLRPSGYKPTDNIFNTANLTSNRTYAWRAMGEKEYNSLMKGEKEYTGDKAATKGNFLAGIPESAGQYGGEGRYLVEFGGVRIAGDEGLVKGSKATKDNITRVWRHENGEWKDLGLEQGKKEVVDRIKESPFPMPPVEPGKAEPKLTRQQRLEARVKASNEVALTKITDVVTTAGDEGLSKRTLAKRTGLSYAKITELLPSIEAVGTHEEKIKLKNLIPEIKEVEKTIVVEPGSVENLNKVGPKKRSGLREMVDKVKTIGEGELYNSIVNLHTSGAEPRVIASEFESSLVEVGVKPEDTRRVVDAIIVDNTESQVKDLIDKGATPEQARSRIATAFGVESPEDYFLASGLSDSMAEEDARQQVFDELATPERADMSDEEFDALVETTYANRYGERNEVLDSDEQNYADRAREIVTKEVRESTEEKVEASKPAPLEVLSQEFKNKVLATKNLPDKAKYYVEKNESGTWSIKERVTEPEPTPAPSTPTRVIENHVAYMNKGMASNQLALITPESLERDQVEARKRGESNLPWMLKLQTRTQAEINMAYHNESRDSLDAAVAKADRVLEGVDRNKGSLINQIREKDYDEFRKGWIDMIDLANLAKEKLPKSVTLESGGLEALYTSAMNKVREWQSKRTKTDTIIDMLEGQVIIRPKTVDTNFVFSLLFDPQFVSQWGLESVQNKSKQMGLTEQSLRAVSANRDPEFLKQMSAQERLNRLSWKGVDAENTWRGNASKAYEEFNRITKNLSREDMIMGTKVLSAREKGHDVTNLGASPEAVKFADDTRAFWDTYKVRYRAHLLDLLHRDLTFGEMKVIEDVMLYGANVGESMKKTNKSIRATNRDKKVAGETSMLAEVKTQGIKNYFTELNKIEKWGLEEYMTHAMRGDVGVTAGRKLIGKARNEKGAVGLINRWINEQENIEHLAEQEGGLTFIIDPEFVPHLDPKIALSRIQRSKVTGKIARQLREEVKGIRTKVASSIASKAVSQAVVIKPSPVFSEFTLEREGELMGEENIADIIPAYINSMERKMAMDSFQLDMRKSLPGMAPNQSAMINQMYEDMKGRYWFGDKLADSFVNYFLEPLGMSGQKFTWSRASTVARSWLAQAKLGYRQIASVINLASGLGHVWTKTNAETMWEAARFIRSDEGKKFLSDHVNNLGMSMIIGEGESSIKNRLELWKPLGTFQAVEKPIREMSFVTSYLYGKQEIARENPGLDPELLDDSAIEFARRSVGMQAFIYNMASLPRVLRSPLGKNIGMFKTYLVKELEFIASLKGIGEWTKYLTMTTVLAGPKGLMMTLKSLPPIAALMAIQSAASGGDDWFEQLESWMNTNMPKAARGAFGYFGIDASAPATFQFPQSLKDWTGIVVGELVRFNKEVIQPIQRGEGYLMRDVVRGTRGAVPAFRTFYDTINSMFTDEGYILDDKGNRAYKMDDYDRYLHTVLASKSVRMDIQQFKDRLDDELMMKERARAGKVITDAKFRFQGGRVSSQDLDIIVRGMQTYYIRPETMFNAIKMSKLTPLIRNEMQAKLQQRIRMFQGRQGLPPEAQYGILP